MSIKFNGSTLTNITYNGTNLTVVKHNNSPVWGKPYTLSISAGSNSSVIVTRTSSPNEHAQTGTLTNGSTIYYGDVISVTYTVSDGYKISTSTINGTTFTSGSTFTVSSNISVVTTAVVSKSWHTVWEGTKVITTTNGATTINGILANAEKTRITGTAVIDSYIENQDTWDISSSTINVAITEKEINCCIVANYDGQYTILENQSNNYIPANYPIYFSFKSIAANTLNCSSNMSYGGIPYGNSIYYGVNFASRGIKVTKIEQYY